MLTKERINSLNFQRKSVFLDIFSEENADILLFRRDIAACFARIFQIIHQLDTLLTYMRWGGGGEEGGIVL